MSDLAKSEPGIPILPADLDSDPWLLNVANGTIDLRTGSVRPHRRGDLITKLCPVVFDEFAECPTWDRTIQTILKRDEALIAYFKRLLGYGITGCVHEQILAICWGSGSNGKSVLINTTIDLLGHDYAIKASRDLFLAKKQDSHPTLMANLFGKRLVVCIETQEGARLDEALVKELTGGDRITARRMREDYWQFDPTHKAILVTNHKPEIRGTDHAIWRRPRLIPFTVQFWNPDDPAERERGWSEELKQDKALPAKLKAEYPGILNWLIAGCLDWQIQGLGMPEAVRTATRAYRSEQDVLIAFVEDACVVHTDTRTRAGDLYTAYEEWCKKSGEEPKPQRRFGMAMTERGFERKTNNGIWYLGIGLRYPSPKQDKAKRAKKKQRKTPRRERKGRNQLPG